MAGFFPLFFLGEKSLEGINPSVLQKLLQTGNLSVKSIVAEFSSEICLKWLFHGTIGILWCFPLKLISLYVAVAQPLMGLNLAPLPGAGN